eukprot:scaffold10585_cov122-Isochrysis_galbana.AAC.3
MPRGQPSGGGRAMPGSLSESTRGAPTRRAFPAGSERGWSRLAHRLPSLSMERHCLPSAANETFSI